MLLNISEVGDDITGIIGTYFESNENARYRNLCDGAKAVLGIV